MNESFKEKLGMLLGFTIAACAAGLFGIIIFGAVHYGLQFFGLTFPEQYNHIYMASKTLHFIAGKPLSQQWPGILPEHSPFSQKQNLSTCKTHLFQH